MGLFFVSWELWQQMTFVLAGAIVIVFVMGLVKLWWNNRIMRKQEIIDEEKRARMTEMRSAGIPAERANEIPFGVRAIQSGVEVAGIWISRPASPSSDRNVKLASTSTLVGMESNAEKKGKFVESIRSNPLPPRSDSLNSTPSITPPVSQFASQNRRPSPHAAPLLSEDTVRKLETHSQSKPVFDTYIPTAAPQQLRRPSQRSSASSTGGDSVDLASRSTHGVNRKSYSSSRSSRLYTSRHAYETRLNYSTMPPESSEKEVRDPFGTPTRTPSGVSALSRTASESGSSIMQSQELSAPEPTFGPGDMHVNKTSRRVNAGFEVLPAGTFGTPQELQASESRSDLDSGSERSTSSGKTRNKLRKKSISQIPRRSPNF